jgi:transposase
VTHDDLLFGFRLQLFAYAAKTSVSEACRVFGVHRSTYSRWKRQVDRHGPEMLRPRERRVPRMPNHQPVQIEHQIVAFSLGHPAYGPDRASAEPARPKWGGLRISPSGVWRVLRRHGLNTRAKRLGLVAGDRSPYDPPRDAPPAQHIDVERPGELVGFDSFFVARLKDTRAPVWQLTAIDVYSSYGWAELGATQTRIRDGRPQTNGHIENLHKTILDASPKAESPPTSSTPPTRCNPNEPHLSPHRGESPA